MKANQFIQDSNKLYTKKEITFVSLDEKQYTVTIDKNFKTTKLSNLISEMMIRANYCKKNDIDFNFVVCQWAMIIKEFTSVKFNTSKDIGKLYKHELEVIEAMANLGIIEQVFLHWDDEEMKKVENLFKNFDKFTSHMHGIELDQQILSIVGEDDD